MNKEHVLPLLDSIQRHIDCGLATNRVELRAAEDATRKLRRLLEREASEPPFAPHPFRFTPGMKVDADVSTAGCVTVMAQTFDPNLGNYYRVEYLDMQGRPQQTHIGEDFLFAVKPDETAASA